MRQAISVQIRDFTRILVVTAVASSLSVCSQYGAWDLFRAYQEEGPFNPCELSRAEVIRPENWELLQEYLLEQASEGASGAPTADTTSITGLAGPIKWVGGTLAPNGKIYGIPYSATEVLIVDPKARGGFCATVSLCAYFNKL